MYARSTVASERSDYLDAYRQVRADSERICAPLYIEDYGIQTVPEVSPPKWHLAHVSWFFETFILKVFQPAYQEFHPAFGYLFNSYYQQVGKMHPRAERGLIARPTVAEVMSYREAIDEAMSSLILSAPSAQWAEISRRLIIGLNHEQQHQELLLTDIKHIFAYNPLRPAYRKDLKSGRNQRSVLSYIGFEAGLKSIGYDGDSFAYDNESPRHQVFLNDYSLANRLVTNGEYQEFIEDQGYQRPEFWLADGWFQLNRLQWKAPLYWEQGDGQWQRMTLGGLRPLETHAPVSHISYYEADAYARWAGQRLPTEAEWENAASSIERKGNFRSHDILEPQSATEGAGLLQMFGDCWEWTSSAYSAYPGYRADEGALGEYNGKFMANQFVLRGGSCVTPDDHIRSTYRNFFYPHERWQFKGLRLAQDAAS
ncbi:MAG: ergothioneine biosynthesis protein EgtB [Thiotrichales bacterium]